MSVCLNGPFGNFRHFHWHTQFCWVCRSSAVNAFCNQQSNHERFTAYWKPVLFRIGCWWNLCSYCIKFWTLNQLQYFCIVSLSAAPQYLITFSGKSFCSSCHVLLQQVREAKPAIQRIHTPVFNTVMVKKSRTTHDDNQRQYATLLFTISMDVQKTTVFAFLIIC